MTVRPTRKALTSAAWVVALVFWMGFIWSHSLVPGPSSASESLFVVRYLKGVFEQFGITDVSMMDHIVRKSAHFSEFLVLGLLDMCATLPARERGRAGRVVCGLVVICVPIVDETIQLFVANRSGQVSDVLLDMCGACAGLLVMVLVGMRHKE